MEENSLPSEKLNPAVNNTQKGISKNFAFLEIGVFEFGFVAVVLFLLFGTLNYFNILPISNVFPKYLSWLSHQTAPQPPPLKSTLELSYKADTIWLR